jgi:hypothetical protein
VCSLGANVAVAGVRHGTQRHVERLEVVGVGRELRLVRGADVGVDREEREAVSVCPSPRRQRAR